MYLQWIGNDFFKKNCDMVQVPDFVQFSTVSIEDFADYP